MGHEHEPPATIKQKMQHELKEMLGIFAYMAFVLCALAAYNALLLELFHVSNRRFSLKRVSWGKHI
jgi:hypothetical protein